MKHFFSINQLTNQEIYRIIQNAWKYKKENATVSKQLFAANLFFEPSTRTKMSFIVAERKLGLEVLDFHADSSSLKKGESLYDTVKTFESIGANVAIIRHESDDWINELASGINIPIINAGAGKKEHPTQCLLDLLTIYEEFGTFKNLNIVIVGDIIHSRVAKSNAHALRRLGANVYLSAAPGFEDDSLDFPYVSIDEATQICDVVMLLRIQHERHTENNQHVKYLEQFGLTKERKNKMKKNAIILHPAPINRGVEIDNDLVECDQSRIFKQMNNGVYVRMALLTHVLQEWGIIDENLVKERYSIVG
ncbi:aspartate carbamoyltransferase catalytic subunit [Ornithinibacillus halotolerans]|uniref:Aspartate carbamoyltransferase n=1 Tax=Ornithinibacillus halotolerans TaxID=1274357 RepID=A0A916WAZ4_9BACI|nr:aspartate carbamoyltransferase catalytic subunit [Ornithinibacillus halotolerans]GGA84069.1 aspartate carbamoyltransferase [Ornithinibacillus halotolerans]